MSITSELVLARGRCALAALAALALAASLAILGGCRGGGESPSPPSPASSASASASSPSSRTLRRGELLSLACQACHTFTDGGMHQVGPNLFGLFGRVAGTVAGFDFSPALRESGLVWTPEALDQWLADPAGFLPGTTMAFTGYQAPDDRAALIEFLVAATSPAP